MVRKYNSHQNVGDVCLDNLKSKWVMARHGIKSIPLKYTAIITRPDLLD